MFIIPNKVTQARYNNKESIHGVRMFGDDECSVFYTTNELIKRAEDALYEMNYESYWYGATYNCEFEISDLFDVFSVINEYGFEILLDYNNYLKNNIGLINGCYAIMFNKLNKEVIEYIKANPITYFGP